MLRTSEEEDYTSGVEDRTRLEIQRILQGGDDADTAGRAILPLIYDELHAIAKQRMRGERDDHTLGATALVNEVWMKLSNDNQLEWRNSAPFFAAASEAMRRILVDHARKKGSQKRGGDRSAQPLTAAEDLAEKDPGQLLAVHEALERLEVEEPRAAEIVRLRFFGGLGVEECASALDVSVRTLHREWAYAKTRLFELLGGDDD